MSTLSNRSPELTPASEPSESKDWQRHEHTADAAKVHAQQLVDELGSVGLAKHAVETVGEISEFQSQLCQALRFASFEKLVAKSKSVESNDGRHWFATRLRNNRWVVWSEEDCRVDRHFATEQEALASVPHNDPFSGSSLLG